MENHVIVYDMLLDAGIQSELIFKSLKKQNNEASEEYLGGHIRYSKNELIDDQQNGVMMSWETPLMKMHAETMQCTGKDILNIGFGMGLIDTEIQTLKPRSHTIGMFIMYYYCSFRNGCSNNIV
jgi:type IV protein arginine methyltransferase